jgi:phosphoglycolate phosphatase
MTHPKKIELDLLIFDLDGTLVDSGVDLANAINHARQIYQLPPRPVEEVIKYIGYGVDNLIRQSIPEMDATKFSELKLIFQSYYAAHCTEATIMYPGVAETLQFYQHKRKAIVSNKPYQFLISILNHLGIANHFQTIIGEDSCPWKKPAPEPLLLVSEQLSVAPERSVMIGDWITDMEAGKLAGMSTIGCLYGIGDPEEVIQYHPDYTIRTFSELQEIID